MQPLLTVLTLPLYLQKEEIGRVTVSNNFRLCAPIHLFFLFLQKKLEKEERIRRKNSYNEEFDFVTKSKF
jgi:hypothetical protein